MTNWRELCKEGERNGGREKKEVNTRMEKRRKRINRGGRRIRLKELGGGKFLYRRKRRNKV